MTATPASSTPGAPPAGGPGPSPAPGSPVARAVLWAGAALLAVVLVWFGTLTARGGHVFVVQTPSMARTAPVGSLVVTEKVDPATLGKGDIITFRPPRIERTYTHRIVEVTPQGFRTKGDLNAAPDGWVVPRDRVVGKAVHLWFGLGWLLRMTPWLVLGGLLTALAHGVAKPHNRTIVDITGSALATAVALVAVRPLVRAETIGFVPAGEHGVKISAVSTGLLPIRVSAKDGRYTDLVAGQLGWVETHAADAKGRYQVIPELHLTWWGWVLFGLFCAGPFLASLFVKDTRPDAADPSDQADPPATPPPSSGRRRWSRVLRPAAAVGTTVALATALSPTQAALTAQLRNSTNTARTRTFFTCLDAMSYFNRTDSTVNGRLYVGYPLGGNPGGSPTVSGTADVSPRGTTASLRPTTSTTTNVGCVSDYTTRKQLAVTLDGTSAGVDTNAAGMGETYANPKDLNHTTWQAWVRTTSTTGGVISCPAGSTSVCSDRTTWMRNNGTVSFGVGSSSVITSKTAVNDGKWHMVVTQFDSSTGMKLWVDGVLEAANATATSGKPIIGYPQFGYSNNNSLDYRTSNPTDPVSTYFKGDMQFVAVYGANDANNKQLGDTEVAWLYEAARP